MLRRDSALILTRGITWLKFLTYNTCNSCRDKLQSRNVKTELRARTVRGRVLYTKNKRNNLTRHPRVPSLLIPLSMARRLEGGKRGRQEKPKLSPVSQVGKLRGNFILTNALAGLLQIKFRPGSRFRIARARYASKLRPEKVRGTLTEVSVRWKNLIIALVLQPSFVEKYI